MKTRSKESHARNRENEQEIKWLDYLLMSTGTHGWKSIFEVREKIDQLLPPHLIYRKKLERHKSRNGKYNVVTYNSLKLTRVGCSIRGAMRKGYMERSVEIEKRGWPRNLGNFYVRLTPKGIERLKRIRRYICEDCFHMGITRPRDPENALCGHCLKRNLRFI